MWIMTSSNDLPEEEEQNWNFLRSCKLRSEHCCKHALFGASNRLRPEGAVVW
jgi:hypothetical protein